ncbi:branched-chain amino acid ABC transporter permease [Petroclostridium sp. X23]|uniref:branched-chain amino acid ABC transporter permease n=1 Tax=Petroclostridium sp. X23 TaxID=3045146 RepID=UPI0024AE0E35|nr:branched-chain amino acid ABC transporter permease [Petroclostridium sp. X23]WHH61251.1 branched-chain amino acid ABC transporter permease [Petroclostridium sp. X23]
MNYWIGVATLTGIYMIAILGVSILTGFTGLFSMGHAGFMAIGAYTSAIITRAFGAPIIVGILAGMLSAMLIGILIGYPTLRLKGDYFVIATLGIGEVVKLAVENLPAITGGARGLSDVPRGTNIVLVWAIVVVSILLIKNFLRSKHGRNCVAIREQELAATSVGVNALHYKLLAMAISCALCGISGALLGHYMHYLHPNMFNMLKSNELIMTVILGGRGSLTGTIIASLVLVPLPEILRVDGGVQEWRMVFYGLLVVVVIVFRPSGLMGKKELTFKDIRTFYNQFLNRKKRTYFERSQGLLQQVQKKGGEK